MTAPFASIEARINAAVFAHLANATVTYGLVEANGELSAAPNEVYSGLVNPGAFVLRVASGALPGLAVGDAVTINGGSYVVCELFEADGIVSATVKT